MQLGAKKHLQLLVTTWRKKNFIKIVYTYLHSFYIESSRINEHLLSSFRRSSPAKELRMLELNEQKNIYPHS